MENISLILSLALIWAIICGFLNLVLLYRRDKIALKIKLPKQKKYNNKVDPIYKLEITEYFSHYHVHRYTIGYNEPNLCLVLSFILLPYPVKILRYSYFESDFEFYVCDYESVKDITKPLSEIYEENLKRTMDEIRLNKEDISKNSNAVESLNKIFNENYE